MTDTNYINDFITGIQRNHLIKRFGMDYHKYLNSNNTFDSFYDFIHTYCNSKSELTDDSRYEIEAKIKAELFEFNIIKTDLEGFSDVLILHNVLKFISSQKSIPVKLPFLGIVNSGDINAAAYQIDNSNDYVILFETETFSYILAISKIIAESLVIEIDDFNEIIRFVNDKEKINHHISDKNYLRQELKELIFNSAYSFPSKTKLKYLRDELRENIASSIIMSIESFILAHEIGHISLGHFNLVNYNSSDKYKRLKINRQQEVDADIYGANLILNLRELNDEFPFGLIGPIVFFKFLSVKDNLNPQNKSEMIDTHPSNLQRLTIVRDLLIENLSEHLKQDFQETELLIDNIMDELIK